MNLLSGLKGFPATTVLVAATLSAAVAVAQQQTTGTPGTPDATITVDSRYLPAPEQKFSGEIGLNASQSKTAWPSRIVPPKGAPNILLILTDDVGFGAPSTFGGVIPIATSSNSSVNDADYKVPFAFTGTINKVTIAVDPPKLSPTDIKKLQSATQSAEN